MRYFLRKYPVTAFLIVYVMVMVGVGYYFGSWALIGAILGTFFLFWWLAIRHMVKRRDSLDLTHDRDLILWYNAHINLMTGHLKQYRRWLNS